MRRQSLLQAVALVLSLVLVASAQAPERKSQQRKADSPRNQLARRFDARSPKLNGPLPDVSGYNVDGEPFSLSSLKGEYSVLVFGCLT